MRSNKTPTLVAGLYILALVVGGAVGASVLSGGRDLGLIIATAAVFVVLVTALWAFTYRLVRRDQEKWRSRRGRSRE